MIKKLKAIKFNLIHHFIKNLIQFSNYIAVKTISNEMRALCGNDYEISVYMLSFSPDIIAVKLYKDNCTADRFIYYREKYDLSYIAIKMMQDIDDQINTQDVKEIIRCQQK